MGLFFLALWVANLIRLLFVDHDDSFSQNIIAYFKSFNAKVTVINHTQCFESFSEIKLHYDGLILSPGPGHPSDYLKTCSLYKDIAIHYPVLGVCLGMQIMMHALGANVTRIPGIPQHGRVIQLQNFSAVLYNSWGAQTKEQCLVKNFAIESEFQGFAMAITRLSQAGAMGSQTASRHSAVQFHPESFRSVGAHIVMDRFLTMCIESSHSK